MRMPLLVGRQLILSVYIVIYQEIEDFNKLTFQQTANGHLSLSNMPHGGLVLSWTIHFSLHDYHEYTSS